ncbi:MAG: ATP-grasp domain-containing protein [Firmicutes bacterium]|nr:ATP-grasp domain-containing protein [Bacillota bacterium]
MELTERIKKCIASFYDNYKESTLVVIANTRSDTVKYSKFDLDTADEVEFFSESEFDEISIQGLRPIKLFSTYYFNELDFIKDILDGKFDLNKVLVFNMARNGRKQGKKSLIPSFCDLLKIIYTGSNAFSQSLCRNKYVYTQFLSVHNLHLPETFLLNKKSWQHRKPITKFIIKPVAESGSIGVSETIDFASYLDTQSITHINNDDMLYQEYICGDEYEVPLFISKESIFPLEPMQIISEKKILDVNTSNSNSYKYKFIENRLLSSKMKKIAILVAKLLKIQNYGRVDFRINEHGEPVIIDISTTPYLSKNSSFYENFHKVGLSYTNLFEYILALSVAK